MPPVSIGTLLFFIFFLCVGRMRASTVLFWMSFLFSLLISIFSLLLFVCSSTSLSAKQFRDLLARKYGVDSGLAMIIKQRAKANEIDRMDLVGNVQGSDCILGESAVHVLQ